MGNIYFEPSERSFFIHCLFFISYLCSELESFVSRCRLIYHLKIGGILLMNVTTLGKGMMDTAYPLHDVLCLSVDNSGPRLSQLMAQCWKQLKTCSLADLVLDRGCWLGPQLSYRLDYLITASLHLLELPNSMASGVQRVSSKESVSHFMT